MSGGFNLSEARRFLDALDPEAESFTFQTFTDSKPKPKPDPLAEVRTGSIEDLGEWLRGMNERGAGVFVTVNETDGRGRTFDNITRVRAVWQEDDGEGKTLPLEPHIEVVTSPGKVHRYLLCEGLTKEDHARAQRRLVDKYGSDKNAADVSRVLRVPGFYHRKGEPHLVHLASVERFLPYTREQILAAFPPPVAAAPQIDSTATEHATEETLRDIRSALCWLNPDDRDTWVRNGCRLRGLGEAGFALWKEWSQQSEKWQPEDALEWNTFGHGRTGYAAIFKEAQERGWPNPLSGRAQDARKAPRVPSDAAILPAFPDDLLALPHGLGELQRWILGYMAYPSPAASGFAALATLAHFAMAHIRVDSRDGLGLNEQFLLLAPSGFGKEDLRKPFGKLTDALSARPRPTGQGDVLSTRLPRLQYSAPASLQGMHQELERHPAQTFLSDEFAEWLCDAGTNSHKQGALGYFMQAYSKAFSTLAAPAAVHKEYKPVTNPRVLIFATSTAERMLEAVTASHADSGALNRFVILIAEQERVAQSYDTKFANYKPPEHIVDLVEWVAALPETTVTFEPEAREYYIAHDTAVLDPLKFSDNRLAGRLNEQAFKMAALIALSDRRTAVSARDLAIGYAIREGLYHRTASLVGYDGAISGMHGTGKALEQIRQRLVAKPFVYRSDLLKVSRKFAGLSVPEREAVMRAVEAEGFAKLDGGKFVSLIHEEGGA